MKLHLLIMISIITGLIGPNKTLVEDNLVIASEANINALSFQSQLVPSPYSVNKSVFPIINKSHLKIMVIDSGIGQNESLNKFIPFDPLLNDYNGHGTHVAGIVTFGRMNNTTADNQLNSICQDVEITACRVDARFQTTAMSSMDSCVNKAAKEKVDIINISQVYTIPDPKVFQAWKNYTLNGGIVVAAAGNNSVDISQFPLFPASYGIRFRGHNAALKNMFVIGNLEESGVLNKSSNYYPGMIAEIGTNTFSTLPDNHFNTMTGTSMAAPLFVHKIARQFCDMKNQILVKN